ncbi:MAG TPA: hypothetical protein GX747_05100, partial [Tenericutes bacterium]|nr:hypothetical protein [Mycoplasmatota bacterium]
MKFNYRNIKFIIAMVVVCFIFYYFMLPPLNLTCPFFWVYTLLMAFIVGVSYEISNLLYRKNIIGKKETKKRTIIIYSVIPVIIILLGIINFILSPIFNSKSYANRITINEDSSFVEDIQEVDFSKLPLLDKNSSQKLGDRVMGQMTDLVSQYRVSDLYTQINYNNDIVRVTPLEYANVIKYFTNRSRGIEGYITVNSVNGKANLIRLKKGMKYMPSALFSKDLYRKLRFDYPTEIFDKESFEIDNDGNPYWIIPTVKYKGIGIKKDITGVIILDPISGKSSKHNINSIPSWVDHVYSANLLINQVNDWGKYKNGFFNSIFGQKGVIATTEGYNYTVMNDDVYLYTGITSVANDESNIGFIMSNLRTKETKFYEVSGAEEYSAMASAEGQVQQMNYRSTFPLLINLKGKPTYLMSLKDNAGLVKMYAFVDVQDYQKVSVTDSKDGIIKAAQNYLGTEEINSDIDFKNVEITINSIKEVIIDGNTYYYFTDTENNKYKAS